ncbi:agmatinase family protein [Chondromyces apiculatus]|uniref:Agmatinase n=1 Tax=Chondromyces apiculatus DSM 436 TaxID=1192034 RepID=A0A017T7U0_9BACT|nr:agmatinase family protein [Chondromyces apiculatus]EYF05309.1 Agmatinase [Chondromyces apiculatus DSM 436]
MSSLRPDGGIYGLDYTPDQAKVILIPVPWEPTTSYGRGTARGPAAILRASHQVDLYDLQYGRVWEDGIAMLEVDPDIVRWNAEACAASEPVIAAGGFIENDPELEARVARVNVLSAKLNERITAIARTWLERGRIVGLVGGDHSCPYGTIAAHAERYPGLGILHIDAHADLRNAFEGFTDSHASIFYNVATRLPSVGPIVQVGLRDVCEEELAFIEASRGRLVPFFDPVIGERLCDGEPFNAIADDIIKALPRDVYVSFDIDGLDPSQGPHTGTPVPGGLTFRQVMALLTRLRRSGRRVVGFDLNEVAPGPSFHAGNGTKTLHGDEWDANVGARILYKLIGLSRVTQLETSASASNAAQDRTGKALRSPRV